MRIELWFNGTRTLIRRNTRGLARSLALSTSLSLCHVRTQGEGGHLQPTEGIQIPTPMTLIVDLHSSELWENKFWLFKPPRLWLFCYDNPSHLKACLGLWNPLLTWFNHKAGKLLLAVGGRPQFLSTRASSQDSLSFLMLPPEWTVWEN